MGGGRRQVLGGKANRILTEMLPNREKNVFWEQENNPRVQKENSVLLH